MGDSHACMKCHVLGDLLSPGCHSSSAPWPRRGSLEQPHRIVELSPSLLCSPCTAPTTCVTLCINTQMQSVSEELKIQIIKLELCIVFVFLFVFLWLFVCKFLFALTFAVLFSTAFLFCFLFIVNFFILFVSLYFWLWFVFLLADVLVNAAIICLFCLCFLYFVCLIFLSVDVLICWRFYMTALAQFIIVLSTDVLEVPWILCLLTTSVQLHLNFLTL